MTNFWQSLKCVYSVSFLPKMWSLLPNLNISKLIQCLPWPYSQIYVSFAMIFFFQLSPMYCRALCQDFTAKKLHACLKNIKNVCKALHKIKTIITVLRTPPHWPGVINFGNLNFRTFISRIFLGLFEFYVFLVFILTLSQFCCCCCARRGSWMLIVKRFSDMSEVLYIEAEGLYYDL